MHIGKVREKAIEKYLADKIKALGGVCIKLNPNWYIGIPDRLCVFRVGTGRNSYTRVVFTELKRPKGGKLSVPQKMWKKFLTNAGAEWQLLATKKEVDEFLNGEL